MKSKVYTAPQMADVDHTLTLLQSKNVAKATFFPDGHLQSVEFAPTVTETTRNDAATPAPAATVKSAAGRLVPRVIPDNP